LTAGVVTSSAKPDRATAVIVGLLAIAVFINYVDRGAIATAAPLIKDALRLTNSQIGVLLSAFFWTYTPGQMLAGALAERTGAYRVLALGLAVWASATALTGLAGGFAMLLGLRLILGLGESAFFPCSSKLLAGALPHHRLGAANGLIGVGLALGPAFGTLVGGLLMARVGWRAVFIVFGLASLVWLWPWLTATRGMHEASKARAPAHPPPSFAAIARRRAAWGAALGHFASNYGFYFLVFWLPLYLVKGRGFSVVDMAQIGGLIYLVYAVSIMAAGWASDRWMAAGASANRVRKTFIVAGSLGAAACLLACAIGGPALAVASLFAAALFFGFQNPMIFSIAQTLAGPGAAGKWMGFQNCIGNVAGIVGPLITGALVDRTGGYSWALAVAAGVSLAGALAWGVVTPKIAPLAWAGDSWGKV
jgi:MFS family permease